MRSSFVRPINLVRERLRLARMVEGKGYIGEAEKVESRLVRALKLSIDLMLCLFLSGCMGSSALLS